MGEEKAPVGVMGVGIGVAILMVLSMVPNPYIHAVL